jgi:hypothetical protein
MFSSSGSFGTIGETQQESVVVWIGDFTRTFGVLSAKFVSQRKFIEQSRGFGAVLPVGLDRAQAMPIQDQRSVRRRLVATMVGPEVTCWS